VRTLNRCAWAAVFVMILGLPRVRGQQQSNGPASQLVPTLQPPLASVTGSDNAEESEVVPKTPVPDSYVLAGAQVLSPGASALSRSFWQPMFSVTSTLDTNAPTANRPAGLTAWTSLYAGIDFRRISSGSDLTLNYLGGSQVSDNGIGSTSIIHRLEFGEKLSWHRSALSFFDQLNYLPEAAFGFGAPGGQELSIQPILTSNQSVLTTRGQRISNSFLTEVDRFLTPRSTLTFVGSYSLLHFQDAGFLNSGETVFQVGFSNQVTRKDTMALLYRFTALRYNNFDQSIDGHILQVSYGRRIAGRLTFAVATGPELGFFRTPISATTGSSGGATSTTSSARLNYWTFDTSMTYQRRRTQFRLAYDRTLSGGAGVLAGAANNQLSGSANRQLSRTLDGGLFFGYARNQGLNVVTPTPSHQSFNYWYSQANFGHRWGRSTNMFLSYQLQFQDSNAGFCVGTNCGKSFVRHTVSLGLDWRSRPIPIQ
jgi:hypothetical protein